MSNTEGFCWGCSGTGMGYSDGSECGLCNGKGYTSGEYPAGEETEPPEPVYED